MMAIMQSPSGGGTEYFEFQRGRSEEDDAFDKKWWRGGRAERGQRERDRERRKATTLRQDNSAFFFRSFDEVY